MKQLPLYSVQRREDEVNARVWHAKRENARGHQTFRRVTWVLVMNYPMCDCAVHTNSGIPCVHQLLVLMHEKRELFEKGMFHVH